MQTVMENETWVHHFELKCEWQLIQCCYMTSPRKEKFRNEQSADKIMVTIFRNEDVIILVIFLHREMTLNSANHKV